MIRTMIKKLHLLPLLYLWVACQDKMFIEADDVQCNGQTINLCQSHLKSWKVSNGGQKVLYLDDCTKGQVRRGNKLLLFVSRGKLYDYGKYKVATVKTVRVTRGENWSSTCKVTLRKSISMSFEKGADTLLIAQKFPSFDKVALRNKCVLTCDEQKDGMGGILAFGAKSLLIDETSKIDMSGKGFAGGAGGKVGGGGGYGGETFTVLEPTMGKGGDVYNAPFASNKDGIGGGGAGDGPGTSTGYKGGPGGINAGGGGADSTVNSDDGAAGGGGGGHFSGGGGGGGGSGCGGKDGGKGGVAGSDVGTIAGGGGRSACPGGDGGNGGEAGGSEGMCYDSSAAGGNAGSASNGGGGGDSCGNHFGGGGGGGGLQFGNTDFKSRLSYGGGGGGGGGSAFSDDPNPGGRGGNGGGLVYLQVGEVTLQGTIDASGQPGECLNPNIKHRSAPGGSGAGGSVVIISNRFNGDPSGQISVSGGSPIKCAFGAGGGGGGGVGRWVVQEKKMTYYS